MGFDIGMHGGSELILHHDQLQLRSSRNGSRRPVSANPNDLYKAKAAWLPFVTLSWAVLAMTKGSVHFIKDADRYPSCLPIHFGNQVSDVWVGEVFVDVFLPLSIGPM
jgi:hypothetical protein